MLSIEKDQKPGRNSSIWISVQASIQISEAIPSLLSWVPCTGPWLRM